MDDLRLLVDLHQDASRQGPGGDSETERAIELGGIDRQAPLKIADIGCGTGAATMALARLTRAKITAVDFLPEFLEVLAARAEREGVEERITPLCASMDDLPFESQDFDVLWSEGAIYNIGFEKGIAEWKGYLKPGGLLVASEMTWLTGSRPRALQDYWDREYPEITTASAKIKVLEDHGYTPVGYFVLPEYCWLENYYEPMRGRFEAFLKRHGESEEARAVVETERREIEFYERYKSYYSYGVYLARAPRA